MAGGWTLTTWRRRNDRLLRLDGNELCVGTAPVGCSMNALVIAQLLPRNQVRAVVHGIGERTWTFTAKRAAARCREAYPELSEQEISQLVAHLEALAEAALQPVMSMTGATIAKRRPSASQVKARIRKGTSKLEGGLGSGFLSRIRK